jgi:transposase-like protein
VTKCKVIVTISAVQLIFQTEDTVEQYEKRQIHLCVAGPLHCPNCGRNRPLESLGYYRRYVTRQDYATPRIRVRRFKCSSCRRTVSLLPSFAQPYKLIANHTIEAFARGEKGRDDVRRWQDRLTCYWKKFSRWSPNLRTRLGATVLPAGHTAPLAIWNTLLEWGGGLAALTARLTWESGITLFGEYKCHLPNPP